MCTKVLQSVAMRVACHIYLIVRLKYNLSVLRLSFRFYFDVAAVLCSKLTQWVLNCHFGIKIVSNSSSQPLERHDLGVLPAVNIIVVK